MEAERLGYHLLNPGPPQPETGDNLGVRATFPIKETGPRWRSK